MSKKLKILAVVLSIVIMSVMAAGCQNNQGGTTDTATPPANTNEDTPATTDTDTTQVGGKIAVLRNMTNSDHTAQFFAGCISEGEAFGYKVDTFMSDGDDVKMQDLMEQALNQDYDIWIVSHANEGYQYDLVSRAVDKGIKVTGFDCAGEHVPGVTYTSQDDKSLASISLDAMIEKAQENGAELPVKFIEVNILGMILPFDIRHSVIEEYIDAGKLESLQTVSPNPAGDIYTDCYNAISAAMKTYGEGEIYGIWAASSFFLDGVVDALNDANRNDVAITAVDISDTEIQRLINVSDYYCCAAVDPYVIGLVNVRAGVSKVLGLDTPEILNFPAVGIFAAQLNANDTMATLYNYFPDFGSSDLLLTPELEKAKVK